MLDEDIQLRTFQSLKVDRNHCKLNLNQLSSLNKLESVRRHRFLCHQPIRFFSYSEYCSHLLPSPFRLLHLIAAEQLAVLLRPGETLVRRCRTFGTTSVEQ